MIVKDSGQAELRTEQDVVLARQQVRRLAVQAGLRLVDQTKLVTAVSELARNTVIYGGGGLMDWSVLADGLRQGVRIEFDDKGPGIPDMSLAMTDGWTSGSGLGLGLTGAKRLVDDFEIESEPGKGTRIMIAKWN